MHALCFPVPVLVTVPQTLGIQKDPLLLLPRDPAATFRALGWGWG